MKTLSDSLLIIAVLALLLTIVLAFIGTFSGGVIVSLSLFVACLYGGMICALRIPNETK